MKSKLGLTEDIMLQFLPVGQWHPQRGKDISNQDSPQKMIDEA